VKLSEPDGRALFDADPAAAAEHLRALGAAAVVVTRGPDGALLATAGGVVEVPAPPTDPVDTPAPGDAVMAGLLHGLLITGAPTDRPTCDPTSWPPTVTF
jgi:fructokinase